MPLNDHIRKYALVTGASSGLGWYLSVELVKRDYNLIAVSNQPAELEELKKKLEQSYPVSVVTLNIDLAWENSAKSIFDYCEEHSFQIDILVNNAGMLNKLTIWLLPIVPYFIIGLIYRRSRTIT